MIDLEWCPDGDQVTHRRDLRGGGYGRCTAITVTDKQVTGESVFRKCRSRRDNVIRVAQETSFPKLAFAFANAGEVKS